MRVLPEQGYPTIVTRAMGRERSVEDVREGEVWSEIETFQKRMDIDVSPDPTEISSSTTCTCLLGPRQWSLAVVMSRLKL